MALLWLVLACAGPDDTPDDETGAPPTTAGCEAAGPMDDALDLADVQALGTHNSYHIEPDQLFDASHAYTQPTLDAQADVGVRAFELDVHLGDDGVFQVFHLPGIDPLSTCRTLGECLDVLLGWSDAHPCHSPFTVWIEPKDELDAAVEGLVPLAGHLTELDAAITDAWPRTRLIQPDDVRGGRATLAEGVAAGWPSLADARGRMLVTLLDSGEHRAEYLDGAPSLEGRVLFVDSDTAADPFAATFKINDAGGSADEVRALVAANFLVTSNVDSNDADDATNSASLAAALDAGPQSLASDQVAEIAGSAYVAALPGGSPRCHPERVPEGCGPEILEPASGD
ncbi:MAG: Ca2+-dependent phosphoinositide-specific phospholipase C [Pseudomonadota bacterium]|nr:Ca2+-dependent phosphoinositide-specific phospholipase C [Pseudomonadota bacterium]